MMSTDRGYIYGLIIMGLLQDRENNSGQRKISLYLFDVSMGQSKFISHTIRQNRKYNSENLSRYCSSVLQI